MLDVDTVFRRLLELGQGSPGQRLMGNPGYLCCWLVLVLDLVRFPWRLLPADVSVLPNLRILIFPVRVARIENRANLNPVAQVPREKSWSLRDVRRFEACDTKLHQSNASTMRKSNYVSLGNKSQREPRSPNPVKIPDPF